MSGTPVENRLTEFWSIMDYANKGYLGTVKAAGTGLNLTAASHDLQEHV
jgi:SNF2 family DNA or RNA helicase